MTWAISFGVAVLGGLCGLLLAGLIANACISWYHVTSREGAAGYLVVFVALGGGLAGLVVSFITARIVAVTLGSSLSKEFGVTLGVLLVIAGVAALICRLLAHVSPTINGEKLNLEVEFRFPPGSGNTNAPATDGNWFVRLDSLTPLNPDDTYGSGEIMTNAARRENGSWIVPTKMPLFTARGKRLVSLFKVDALEEKKTPENIAFVLPVPAHPAKISDEWSDWFPPSPSADQVVCRWRVQIQPPPVPYNYEAEQVALKEAEFIALPADVPLARLLPYTTYDQPQTARALEAIAKRPNLVAEVQELALGDDTSLATPAIRIPSKLSIPLEPFNAPMQKVAQDIAERIRKVNASPVPSDPSDYAPSDIGLRFMAWHTTICVLREKAGGDFTPELKTILELSRVRKDSRSMQLDVCRIASYYLHEWAGVAPLPTDPPPR